MKCRNIVRNPDGTYNIVWFKSVGSSQTGLPDEYGTFPIVGRPSITVQEFPDMICGFTNVSSNESVCTFSAPRPDSQKFSLEIQAEPGQLIEFSFYNTNNPSEVFYQQSFNDGNLNLVEHSIPTGSDELKPMSFKIKGSGIATISKFFLRLFGVSESTKSENYVENEEAVAKSLIQRLAVIKNELWYSMDYGLPLLDKNRNKAIIDSSIINIISSHEGVSNIITYNSSVDQNSHTYRFSANINTIYNKNISISSEYSI